MASVQGMPRTTLSVVHATSRRGGPTTAESLREYARGLGGGFLFSLPLLFTMEIWEAAFTVPPLKLLAGLAGSFVLLCGYNAFAGLRHDSSFVEIAIDSVEELGLGIATCAAFLALLGPLDDGLSPTEALPKILLGGIFVAVGFSVGTAQLGVAGDDRGERQGRHTSILSEVVLAACGAFLIAANVAPTEEVLMLAMAASLWQLLGLLGMALAMAALLLHHSHFIGSSRFAGSSRGDVLLGSAITCGVALAIAGALLWFFGRFERHPLEIAAAQMVVLSVPATLGAAAGRLLLR
jgi:putative integral membrane protein (TIGR02587 family)